MSELLSQIFQKNPSNQNGIHIVTIDVSSVFSYLNYWSQLWYTHIKLLMRKIEKLIERFWAAALGNKGGKTSEVG